MCTVVLKETVNYYSSKGTVFCTMLFARKAFDCIEYCKLLQYLVQRKLPFVVLRLLLVMHTNHVTMAWYPVQVVWRTDWS